MREQPFLVDGFELLEDAIQLFVGGVASDQFDVAERFAALAFYLLEHRVRVAQR